MVGPRPAAGLCRRDCGVGIVSSGLRLHYHPSVSRRPRAGVFHTGSFHVPSTELASTANRLLAALPRRDRQHFLARCELVDLVFAEVLAEPGERIHHVYFPTESFISLTTRIEGCASLEVGLVGDEGMLGISLVLGVDASPLHALVQGAGPALRMDTTLFLAELERSIALQRKLRRYLHVVMAQLAQTTACNRFHVLSPRASCSPSWWPGW